MIYGHIVAFLFCKCVVLSLLSNTSSAPWHQRHSTATISEPSGFYLRAKVAEKPGRKTHLVIYSKLRHPTKRLLRKVKSAIDLYVSKYKIRAESSVSYMTQKCQSSLVRWPGTKTQPKDRLVSAIHIFQEFVAILQIIQEIEINQRGEVDFASIRKIREVECKLRSYIDVNLREAARHILPMSEMSKIPPYKIGVYKEADRTLVDKKTADITLNKVILGKLEQIWLCVKIFETNDVNIEAAY